MKRYLVRGVTDGLLSTLGIVIGASTAIDASAQASHIIIAAGVGGGLANGLSNVLGAYMGEKAALHKRLEEMEGAMLREEALRGTKIGEKAQDKIISGGIFDGLATIGGSMVPVLPFLLVLIFTLSELSALYMSIVISLAFFFILGVYIGRISKENLILSGLKVAAFAGGTALLATLIRTIL